MEYHKKEKEKEEGEEESTESAPSLQTSVSPTGTISSLQSTLNQPAPLFPTNLSHITPQNVSITPTFNPYFSHSSLLSSGFFSPFGGLVQGLFPLQSVPVDSGTLQIVKTGFRFELKNQPNQKQERGPLNQQRYLLPNPITIGLGDSNPGDPSFVSGRVKVSLADSQGKLMKDDIHVLICADNLMERPLSTHGSANFPLLIRASTEHSNMFKLVFTVNYRLQGIDITFEEVIQSRTFVVYTKRGNSGVIPLVMGLMPLEGQGGTELWIKGSGFRKDKVRVSIGGVAAIVVETLPTVLTATVPQLPYSSDTLVDVIVSHKMNKKEAVPAEHKPKFLFKPG